MLTLVEEYTVLVVSRSHDHQATCTCGWESLRRAVLRDAEVEALIHELSHAPEVKL